MANTAVINPRRHQLLRSGVSRRENFNVLLLGLILVAFMLWVAFRGDDYDPASRDIAPELLTKDVSEQKLFPPPLKVLSDPNAAALGNAPVAALQPFPPAIVSDGWSLASRVRRFEQDTLFEKINGEAPKFLKQGFQSLHYVVLRSAATGEEIGIELFDQNDRGGSLGLLGDHRANNVEIENIDGVDYFPTAIGAIGRRGQFFFRIIGDADTQTVQEKSLQLVAAMAQLPDDQQELAAAQSMLTESLNFDPSQVSFQKANVFKFDFASEFWFASDDAQSDVRVFLHESESDKSADQLFEQLREELSFDYALVDEDIGTVMLQHSFLKNYFSVGVSDNWIYGIENAASEDDADVMMQRLYDQLSGDDLSGDDNGEG